MSATTFRFDRFELRPAERLLLRDGDPVLIGSRPLDLLRVLLEHAGELVSKDRLLEQAWTRLVVKESNLHVQVSQLRKLIGAEPIATVAGLGYCVAVPLLNATPRALMPAMRMPWSAAQRRSPTPTRSFVRRAC